jgi:hypothetical protein
MDVRRLERAALGPYRLYRLVESRSAHRINPPRLIATSSALLTSTLNVPTRTAQATFLVPGGRYLLVGDIFALSIWDLGPPDCSALSLPLLVARIAMPSHPVMQNHGRPYLSVRARADDILQVAIAVGGLLYVFTHSIAKHICLVCKSRLAVYHINPSLPSPSFQCIATLPIDSTSYPGSNSACTALSASDDVVLVVLGADCGSLAWNFREGWYCFGPRRSSILNVDNHVSKSDYVLRLTRFTYYLEKIGYYE